MESTKIVKVMKVPGGVKEVAVPAEATVSDILAVYSEETGQSADGFSMRVNDSAVDGTYVPANGANIVLAKMVKGN